MRESLAMWKDDHNTIRPHSALGNLPPAVFAKISPRNAMGPGAPLHGGLAPRRVPLHHRANIAQMKPGLSSSPGDKGLRSKRKIQAHVRCAAPAILLFTIGLWHR